MYRIPVGQVARHLRRSMIPVTLSNSRRPSSHFQQVRGFGSRWLVPRWRHPLWQEDMLDMSRTMERQLRNMERMMDDLTSGRGWMEWAPRTSLAPGIKVKHDDKMFEVAVDVSRFAKSGDIELKTSGNRLVVSAKDTASTDNMGSLYTQLHREIIIPEDVLPDTLVANMTEDGQLLVSAKVKPREKPAEKIIEIKRDEKMKAEN